MAVGFTPPRTIYELDFTGTDLEGLHVKVKSASMETRIHALNDLRITLDEDAETRDAKHAELCDLFFEHVTEWDLEDEHGNPVPVSLDGLKSVCDPPQVGMVVGYWRLGRTRVPDPLDRPSPGTSLAEIPMTVLSSTPAHAA